MVALGNQAGGAAGASPIEPGSAVRPRWVAPGLTALVAVTAAGSGAGATNDVTGPGLVS